MIELKNASLIKSGKTLFRNLNLSIQEGDQVILKGDNGSGKTDGTACRNCVPFSR